MRQVPVSLVYLHFVCISCFIVPSFTPDVCFSSYLASVFLFLLTAFRPFSFHSWIFRLFLRIFCGSWISDPGSQTHIFESLVTNFWVKSSLILWKLAQIVFLQHFENEIIFNFVKFVATKKGMTIIYFSSLSFVAVFGSGMGKNQDPG